MYLIRLDSVYLNQNGSGSSPLILACGLKTHLAVFERRELNAARKCTSVKGRRMPLICYGYAAQDLLFVFRNGFEP